MIDANLKMTIEDKIAFADFRNYASSKTMQYFIDHYYHNVPVSPDIVIYFPFEYEDPCGLTFSPKGDVLLKQNADQVGYMSNHCSVYDSDRNPFMPIKYVNVYDVCEYARKHNGSLVLQNPEAYISHVPNATDVQRQIAKAIIIWGHDYSNACYVDSDYKQIFNANLFKESISRFNNNLIFELV